MSSVPPAQRGGHAVSSLASRSLMTTAATNNGMTKKFIFGSEWHFLPEGVKSLTQRFNKVLENKDLDATLEWNAEDATFRISCLHPISNQVWDIFSKIVQDFIAQESGCDLDDSDDESYVGESKDDSTGNESAPVTSNKIQLLVKWKEENGLTETVNDSDKVRDGSLRLMLGLEFPEKVRYYKSKTTWECEGTNPSLDEIVSDNILAKLEGLISCEFFENLDQSKIYIGAASEEECLRAVFKLDNVRKNWIMRNTYMKHLFYAEEIENYQVSFKHLLDVKKKFFETTLLDNLQLSASRFNYRNLLLAVTVRCSVFNAIKARYIPFKGAKYRAAVDFESKDFGPREWKDWEYNHYIPQGKAEENAMTRFERYTEQRLATQQSEQRNETEQTELQPQTFKETNAPSTSTGKTPHAGETQRWVLGQDQTSSTSSVQGHPDRETSNRNPNKQEQKPEQYASWDTYRPYLEERYGRKNSKIHVVQSSQVNVRVSTPQQRASAHSSQMPQSLSSLRSSSGNVPQTPRFSAHESSNPSTASTALCTNGGASLNILDEDISMDGVPVLQPMRNAAEPSTSVGVPAPQPIRTVPENPILVGTPVLLPIHDAPEQSTSGPMVMLRGDPFGSPIRVLQDYPVLQLEAMQPVDEVATRTFHSTMNQKASKPNQKSKTNSTKCYSFAGRLELPSSTPTRQPVPKAPAHIIDPTPQFIADINLSFDELLQGLRGFQGELNIQVEFGRILLKGIHRKFITRGDSERSIEPESVLEFLGNPNGPPTAVFTKVLTVLPADISYLVEMRDRQGYFMWVHDHPSSWKVVYEVLCLDTRTPRHRPFTIEIDGENFSCQAKTRRDFGAINVHGVNRHWDFRVSAAGVRTDGDTDPAYKDFAKIVKDSLHIPKGLAIPMLFFEVPHSLRHFAVFGVRARRIYRYRSQNSKSMLNVSEVRELQMFDVEGDGCTIWKALGSNQPDTALVEQGQIYKWLYLWHEVSISCPEADEMFEQNKSIELGEETSWDSKKLQDVNTVQSLYLPACEMLKQMDSVGFYNDNEIDAESNHSASVTEQLPDAEYFFW